MQCGVCFNDYSTTIRKDIACVYCAEKACLHCIKIYVLENASNPKCMHCHKLFTTDFIDAVFSKGFRRGDLRKRRIQNLVELEKSLLPETTALLENRRNLVELMNLRTKISVLTTRIVALEVIDPLLNELRAVQARMVDLDKIVRRPKEQERTIRYQKCPKCPGYIPISLSGKCRLCEYELCRSCGDEKADRHACNPDSVASMDLIKESCKPCPNCGLHINRVSGCSQMFCTSCHTPFDWNTGRKVSGPIHNPHYFDFMRTHNVQNLQAHDCNDNHLAFRNVDDINRYFSTTYSCYRINRQACQCTLPECPVKLNVVRMLQGTNYLMDLSQQPFNEYSNTIYEPLRIRFLEGSLTDKTFAAALSTRETTRIKRNRLLEINKMFAAVANDVITKFRNDIVAKVPNVQELMSSMEALRTYTLDAKIKVVLDFSDSTVFHALPSWAITNIPIR